MKKPQSIVLIFNAAKDSRCHFQQLKKNFLSRLNSFTAGRDRQSQKELESDFANVLDKWGIKSRDEICDVIFILRLRIMLLAILPALYGTSYLFVQLFNFRLVFFMLTIPCIFGILTAVWRISVLKNMRFMPFTRWLLRGCGLWA